MKQKDRAVLARNSKRLALEPYRFRTLYDCATGLAHVFDTCGGNCEVGRYSLADLDRFLNPET